MRNLGTFTSVNAVWETYPSGGMEGDYVTVNSVVFTWNKYFRGWESDGSNTDTTTAREMKDFWGDVNVQNNLAVAGTLRCHRAKFLELGLFPTIAALQAAYPNPEEDSWAYVIDSEDDTKADLYSFKNGSWTSTEAVVLIEQTLDAYALKENQGITEEDDGKVVNVKIEGTTKQVVGCVSGAVNSSLIATGAVTSAKLDSGIITSLGKADTAYQKPSGGIPSSDMESAVQTSLGKADSAYQKPSGGIPSTDLSSGLQSTISGKLDASDFGLSENASHTLVYINKAGDEFAALGTGAGAIETSLIAGGAVTKAKFGQDVYDYFCVLKSSGTWSAGPGLVLAKGQIILAQTTNGTLNIMAYGSSVASGEGIASYIAPDNVTIGITTTGSASVTYRIYDTLASVVAQLNS